MKRILLLSVFDTFEYVMDHYYPFGMEEYAQRKDTYAVISIQDTHTEGFGLEFTENKFCRDVLTLRFDDVTVPVDGAVMFDAKMAESILDFIERNDEADTLVIHCYAGQSRSRAVALAASRITGLGDRDVLEY